MQVPYNPVPDVKPSGQGEPAINPAIPADAFGGVIGQATQHLGGALEKAGDELFNRAIAIKHVQNESEAKEADAQYMIETGKIHAEFGALQGKARVDAFQGYIKNIQDLRTKMRAGLSNDEARRMFDSNSLSTMGRTIFNGAGAAAAASKEWAAGSSRSRIDAIKDDTYHNPDDDEQFDKGLKHVESEVRDTQAPIAGWDKDQTEQAVTKDKSNMIAMRIAGTARTEPFKAKDMLEKYRSQLHFDDLDRAEKLVQSQLRSVGARNISDQVNAQSSESKKETPLQDRIDEGMRKAKKIAPDDPTFQDYTRDRIIADFNRQKAVKQDELLANRNIIEGALVGGVGGKIPTTREELIASGPGVEMAWNNLDEVHQRQYMKALAQNAKGDTAWNADALKRYQELKGMAHSSPLEFLDTDVVGEKMPNSAKRELINLQARLKGKADQDPRVTHALQVLRPLLTPAGLERSKDKERYDQFVGALQDAMTDYQTQNKKLPDAKAINEMGSRLLQEQSTPGFINRWATTPTFEMEVPAAEAVKIENDPAWQEISPGFKPTPQQIQRIYVRKMYQKLYSGKVKELEGAPQPPASK